MLTVQGLRAGYGHVPALFDIDLSIEAGQIVLIVGANGAGKSTLLKTIVGAITPTDGEITFRGERITATPAHKRKQMGISLSPEGRQVFPTLTVRENLVSGTYGLPAGEVGPQVAWVEELFPRLRERSDQKAGSLSGGEQQMLAIGRALMSKPRLLLIDELSLGLAPIIVQRISESLLALCENGMSVLMVEQAHAIEGVRVDHELTLEKGRFVGTKALAPS